MNRRLARVASVVALCGALALGLGTEARASFVSDGADYLLQWQDTPYSTGGFFADADHVSLFHPVNQGRFGSAMLMAFAQTGNSAYLNSAIAVGNAILDADNHSVFIDPTTCGPSPCGRARLYFNANTGGSAVPIVPTQTAFFLQRLSAVSGDTSYSTYLQNNLWSQLSAGTYAANSTDAGYTASGYGPGGVNTTQYVSYLQGLVEWDFLPWMLARTAIAANEAGEIAIRDDLFAGILAGLENAFNYYGSYDVYALAAAIWASAITGVDLDPTVGEWASANSTADLAALLAGFAELDGGFLPDSCGTSANILDPCYETSDAETTGQALLALHAVNPALYWGLIQNGLSYLEGLQGIDGYIATYSDTDAAHADILQAYASVPEPMTIGLLGAGLIGFAAVTRRRRAR